MNKGVVNNNYLKAISVDEWMSVMSEIAKHYGISVCDAHKEVTDVHAEYLFEYIPTSIASTIYTNMRSGGFI